MKKIFYLIFLLFLFTQISFAQQSEILLNIGENEITKEEFLRIYKKNNQNVQSGEKTDLEEYLDMFINFKLKVYEAERLGIDTIPSVKNELSKYKNELAKPYLLDSQVLETLAKEAYKRSQKEVKASHILIKLPRKLSYEDTLFTYEKAMGVKKRITVKDEDFVEVAKATSDDPSVKSNGGNVGFFSAFQMVYPFEDAVYNLEMNEISDPVRTRFGYHIIKKTGERDAKGKIKVAHIMLLAPKSMDQEEQKEKKEKINEIYHRVMKGENFSELAKTYSEDKGSAINGGELPWFGVGRMVPSFEEAAFSLDRIGEVSKPIRTSVGWHIIKLLDRKEIGTYEESKDMIVRKIQNDPRYQIAKDSLIMDLKRQYNYKLDSAGILKLTDQLIDEEEKLYLNRIIPFLTDDTYLFEFDGNVYQIKDFARYLQNLPKELTSSFKDKYLFDEAFKRFSNNEVIKHEKNQLKEKYPEYKYVVKEYHDGILLFEIMDRKIWSKASEDSAGLKKYYERNKENYKWGERYRGKIYICESEEILKEVKKLKKGGLFRKSYSDKEVLDELNTDEKKRVKIIEDLFHKGDHPIIDNEVWNIGNQKSIENKHYIVKGEIVPPSVKSLEEARGSVIADYQNYLEEQWIKELRDQYSIEINEKVLEQLKEKSEK